MTRSKGVEKVSVSLPRELLEKIEDYRVRKRKMHERIPSRSKVITVLLEKALSICEKNDDNKN